MEEVKAVLKQFLPRFNRRFWRSSQMPGTCLPSPGAGSAAGANPVFQAPSAGGPGQYREVPQTHPATTARSATPQLCREQSSWCLRG